MNGRLPVAPPTREALGADDVAVPELHVESFILANVSPRDDDLSGALSGPTPKTVALWAKCKELLAAEFRAGGCLGVDASRACTITSHAPAWIDPELDDVVPGLQTESPLVRGIKPLGGSASSPRLSRSTRTWRFPQISSTRTAKAARDAPTTTASSTSTPRRCAPREEPHHHRPPGHVRPRTPPRRLPPRRALRRRRARVS